MRYALNKEQWTGDYWIDGKKIYRLTIMFENIGHGASKSHSLSDKNIAEVMYITGIEFIDDNWNVLNRPWGTGGGDIVLYETNTLNLKIANATTGLTIEKAYATIFYTKTTEGSES